MCISPSLCSRLAGIEPNVSFAEKITEALELDKEIQELARKLSMQKSLIVMGRGYNFATCLEGALVGISCDPLHTHSKCCISYYCRKSRS